MTVYVSFGVELEDGEGYERGTNAARGYHKVIFAGHAAGSFYYVGLIVWDNFDTLEIDAEGEAELCKVGRVGVDCLKGISN